MFSADNRQLPDRAEQEEARLRDQLKSEIRILRELLSNIKQEQNALLDNDADAVKSMLTLRDPLLTELMQARKCRQDTVNTLQRLFPDVDGQSALLEMLSRYGSLSSEIALLRDQVVGLLNNLERQCERNNYLIRHRVDMGRKLIEALHPAKAPQTYNKHGGMGPYVKTATVAIINHEG